MIYTRNPERRLTQRALLRATPPNQPAEHAEVDRLLVKFSGYDDWSKLVTAFTDITHARLEKPVRTGIFSCPRSVHTNEEVFRKGGVQSGVRVMVSLISQANLAYTEYCEAHNKTPDIKTLGRLLVKMYSLVGFLADTDRATNKELEKPLHVSMPNPGITILKVIEKPADTKRIAIHDRTPGSTLQIAPVGYQWAVANIEAAELPALKDSEKLLAQCDAFVAGSLQKEWRSIVNYCLDPSRPQFHPSVSSSTPLYDSATY